MWGRCGAGRTGLSHQPRPPTCSVAPGRRLRTAKNSTHTALDGDGTPVTRTAVASRDGADAIGLSETAEMLRDRKRLDHGQQEALGVWA
jgi:hypothetical protein